MKVFLCLIIISTFIPQSSYALTDGILATDLVGQYDQTSLTSPVPVYTKSGANDGPNSRGFSTLYQSVFDTTNHRYFIVDGGNNRVLVYNLNTDDTFGDTIADYVLGQPNFYTNTAATTASGLSGPRGVAYDAMGNKLFVSEETNNRVLVFDVSVITNGEDAINVLGQTDFTTATATTTQAGMNNPRDLAYDAIGNRLFVAQGTANRVTVYNVASITNGEDAINVLGQLDFTTTGGFTTQSRMNGPRGLAYDSTNNRLFVGQEESRRVTVYDVAAITNGENAVNVLGQASFASSLGFISQAGNTFVWGVEYDNTNSRLFVSGYTSNRILVYDVAAITNGENAVNVLGQANYATSTAGTSQTAISSPRSFGYNPTNQRLFVSDSSNNRLLAFDVNAITDGEAGVDLLGQYDETSFTDPVPVYTKSGVNNSPNRFGFKNPQYTLLDSTNHRLFVGDYDNNRILVYNLNSSNVLVDKLPDYVLGQPNFYTNTAADTQSGIKSPKGFAFDAINNRLFVAESGGNRVKVFDVATITDGENAINILGQTLFTTATSANTQSGMNSPQDMVYDATNSRLFVAEGDGNRVKVFDVATITDGENAINILGQTLFTTATSAETQSGLNYPAGLAYDPTNNRLFVAEVNSNRVKVFDVATITDGENAINILGQTLFTTATSADTQSGMNIPLGLAYDSLNNRLFVSELLGNRIKVWDVASITDGENAVNVIGQANFTASTAATSQAGMNFPRGVSYSSSTNQLFVADSTNNRLLIFSLSAPSLSEVTPIGTAVNDAALNYTFNTSGAGNISYGGSCTSSTTSASVGNNTVTLSPLTPGMYNDCTITVTDINSYASNPFPISSFNIVVHSGGTSSVIIPQVPQTLITPITTIPPIIIPSIPIPTVCNTGDIFSTTTGLPCTTYINTPTNPESSTCPTLTSIPHILKLTINHPTVKSLQQILNCKGYVLAQTGAGSSTQETNYFGILTDKALRAFQTARGIKVDGIVGSETRGELGK